MLTVRKRRLLLLGLFPSSGSNLLITVNACPGIPSLLQLIKKLINGGEDMDSWVIR